MKLRGLMPTLCVSERRPKNRQLRAFLTLATNIFEFANFYVRKALIPYLQKLGSMNDTELELLAIIQVLNVEL